MAGGLRESIRLHCRTVSATRAVDGRLCADPELRESGFSQVRDLTYCCKYSASQAKTVRCQSSLLAGLRTQTFS
jgi:hypothetical protein